MAFLETDTLGQERFSLLLLEPGEIYYEDFSVYYYPSGLSQEQAISRRQRGHLKLCSKSIVFVPKEIQFPILKLPLKFVQDIDEWSGGLFTKVERVIKITADQTVEMKEKNIITPFIFKKEECQHIFSLNYASVDDCLPQMCQVLRASTLPPGDQQAMLNAIMLSRQSRVKFNTSWLEDIYEKIILETRGDRITPLATNPGRIMLTSSRLYFQPFNNIDKWPVLKLRLKDIKRLICRRFLLRQLGLEIYCGGTAPVTHLYLAFNTEESRNQLYEEILSLPDLSLEDTGQEDMTLKWQSGVISNYDYLLYLNSLADRSFNDLSQYPVMPWVIQDYTSSQLDLKDESVYRDLSKPIGALNEDRLERIKERLPDLPEPKFLYGSHYSSPGYVLFYLARIAPEYVLCLQNGKFDHPDRMFNNLYDTWNNVLTGASDFKELIPEFFSDCGDFLTHRGIINFGFRNDGRPVGDVELPPWAKSSSEFVSILRQALESDIVSKSIHLWIDLIFGWRQRGEEAWEADNVFYHLTYEGAVDLYSIKDEAERRSLETQIMEFGQTPKQLFKSPHPQRFTSQSVPKFLSVDNAPRPIETSPVKEVSSLPGLDNLAAVEPKVDKMPQPKSVLDLNKLRSHLQYTLHKDAVTEVRMSPDGLSTFSVSQDSFLKMYSLEEQRQLRSVNMSLMALSSCEVMEDNKTIVVGSWDNKVYFYSIEYGRVLDTLHAHDDAVSCVRWKASKLFTASWDSTVKVWEMDFSNTQSGLPNPDYVGQLDHDEGVTCMDIDDECVVMVTGTKDGQVALWDLSHFYTVATMSVHSSPVLTCLLSSDKRRIFCSGSDRLLKVIDVETMTEIFTKDLTHEICCMTRMGGLLLTGDAGGQLAVWDMDVGQVTQTLKAHQGPVTCVDASHAGTLLTGGSDRTVMLWKEEV
ncbi:protein FAN [Aplysia californica]|uniref:Protein FAN n=1 Tax=Aplysia californica TaxID=6500 RepID=A0ABM1A427_APLCA|nr:protein FAN [Aplysia californica]